MKEMEIGGRRVCICGKTDCRTIVYLIAGREETKTLSGKLPGVRLVGIDGVDWNRELTPWPAKSIFRGKPDFGGGAAMFLTEIREHILPEAERGCNPGFVRCIAGYSLAGLFAMYASLTGKEFCRAASVSGSLWYENWTEFVKTAACCPERAYLSVGERERMSGKPAFRGIEDCTRLTEDLLRRRGAKTVLELNPGGHFDNPGERMERALRWLTDEEGGEER